MFSFNTDTDPVFDCLVQEESFCVCDEGMECVRGEPRPQALPLELHHRQVLRKGPCICADIEAFFFLGTGDTFLRIMAPILWNYTTGKRCGNVLVFVDTAVRTIAPVIKMSRVIDLRATFDRNVGL